MKGEAKLTHEADAPPVGWSSRRLLDICRPRQWPTISRDQFTEHGYPVYGANGQIGLYSQFTHDSETIAITCRGATCGTINLVPAKSYITGNAMALDDLDASLVVQSYLYQALRHWGVANSISGSAQPQITRQSLNHVTFPFPPLDEQRRIAEVLRSVDDTIAAAECEVVQAEHALNLKTEKLLVHDVVENANECRLVDLIASLDAGVSVNSEGRPAADGEIGILKTSCVSAGRFDPDENKVVRPDEVDRTRVQLSANSIVISRMNTLDLVGANAFIVQDYPNLYLPDRLWLLKTKPSVVCRWLAFYMKTVNFRVQIADIATGTSGSMKNISKGRLADLALHVPEYAKQELAVGVLMAMEGAIISSRSTLFSYRAMRRSLMSDLLSGRVRVPA